MRIVVAMSGGVDSSVAAALLTDAGHDVVGLSMQLYDQRENEHFGSCCTLDDLHDARRTAATLDIPHYIVNYESSFNRHVVRNFVNEYAAGRTPIPCVHCNAELKFSHLLDRATALNTEAVATGHYAQVDREASTGRYRLRRGVDRKKDQSYFLFSLNQTQLARAAFPVGSLNKAQVRSYARDRGLPVADKPDSQGLCFVANGEHATFVETHATAPLRQGVIRDESGRILGQHDGVHHFTIGQRKGLKIASG
ncbi:MAG TPA: tRNA 2-thiouridine(34) synthase MnmA, partial [Nitrospirales bacterium]|nr:tRNA 2-thiouridine(34) synthase MnmA [Nitrospirales bacterium]